MEMSTIIAEVGRWPAADRLKLMDRIWAGLLGGGHEPALTPAQLAELDRRLSEDDASPDDVVAWEEVKSAALKRTGR
jgi:putative addiction module component (TIGR02574 family)